MSYHPPPRLVRWCLGVSLGLWVLLGSCAVWSGTAGARLNRDLVAAVEEGIQGVRDERSSQHKHTAALVRETRPTADVPSRIEVEVIGDYPAVGVAYPKLYAWMERRAEDDGRVLNEGVLEIIRVDGEVLIMSFLPSEKGPRTPDDLDLESALGYGRLPADVAAFARRKLSTLHS